MKSALVTGGSGFIGSHLAEQLLHKGYTVRCLLRKTSSMAWLKDLKIDIVHGDVLDTQALAEAVRGVDYVYHSAGLTKAKAPEEYYRANAEGTRNLLLAVQQHAPDLKRFIFLSSQTAAGPSPTATPVTEDFPSAPITTYGMSKLQAEVECRKFEDRLPITIVRLPAVYGPRDKDMFEFFSTVRKGLQPVVGFGEKYVSLLHVADVVRGLIMAGESEKSVGQTYFLSSKKIYGWMEVGQVTRKILGRKAMTVKIPEAGVYVVATFAELLALFSKKPALINYEKARDMVQNYWTCDSAKAKRDFGFEQEVGLEEGVRDTVTWCLKQGWLKP
jgi:nucleoside-diphosphate-sugar epimerase